MRPLKTKYSPATTSSNPAFAMLFVALVMGCGGTDEPTLTAAEKETAAVETATKLCMDTLHGNVAVRAEAIDGLLEVTETYPNNARAHFFLGMCSLASFVEDGTLAGRGRVEFALERVLELEPTHPSALGNLALARFNAAFFLKNQTALDKATQELIAATDAHIFNTFVLSFGLLQLPRDTPYPQMAVDRIETYNASCPTYEYCRNSEKVPGHDAGLFMHSGDAYVRIGNQAKAEAYYQKALSSDGSDSWVFANEAKAWAMGTAERIALHTDADPTNDPTFFLTGPRACRGCHQ